MENHGFDRQKHNIGGQPDGLYRDNGPGPQDGSRNDSGKNRFWAGALVGALITAFVGLIVMDMSAGIYIFGKQVMSRQPNVAIEGKGPGITDGSNYESGVDFNRVTAKMSMIQQIIDLHSLYDEDAGSVEDFIYRGMLVGLDDPYSTYYTEKDFRSVSGSTEGIYSGIGAMLSQSRTTELCTIVRVFEGSPTLEAGIQPGDIIYKVGDTSVASESLDVLANDYIKGEEGTDVAITVYRADKDEHVDMSVTRRKIEVSTMEYSMLDDEIGRITVSEFDVITVKQFKQAVGELQKDGMEGLIIDLRSSPGGVLDNAVRMVDHILPDDLDQYEKSKGKTLIVYTADKSEKDDVFTASDGYKPRIPIVILVNGDLASAPEVFTGAPKGYDQATVMRATSYGKGVVQNLMLLGDGSAIKITTAHYYTPSGFDLHGKGIELDVEAELDEKLKTQTVVKPEEDDQLRKAVQVLKESK